jgi:hypothetical protein
MGNTGDGSYAALYGHVWAGFLDSAGLRLYRQQGAGWQEVAVPPLAHPVREIRHFGLAFDQAARHVICYERAGEVWVRQWDPLSSQWTMRGPWPGVDPCLLADATVNYHEPDSDVLLFHLSPDRTQLYMRVQREQYAVAHLVHTFPGPQILDQAVALPYQLELLGSSLDAPDATGLVLRSDPYPVYLPLEDLGAATFQPPATGSYFPVVVVQDLGLEDLGTTQLAPPQAGSYTPVVIVADLGLEDLGTTQLAPPQAGSYAPVVIVADLGLEDLGTAQLAPPTTGTYTLVVVIHNLTQPQYAPPDLLGTATLTAPTQGSYDAA